MSYDPNVPENPSDSFSDSQPELMANFLALYNIFTKNHVSLDAVADLGNHTVIELAEQENPLQTNVSEISGYSKDVEDQTDQLFLRYQGNGQEFQYTNYQIYPLIPVENQVSYFTFLPGKLIVYFGSVSSVSLTENPLFLYPPIAKNVMSISFCRRGSTPAQFSPPISFPEDDSGFVKKINFVAIAGQTFDYIIVANT